MNGAAAMSDGRRDALLKDCRACNQQKSEKCFIESISKLQNNQQARTCRPFVWRKTSLRTSAGGLHHQSITEGRELDCRRDH
jgi:hypothetical protein